MSELKPCPFCGNNNLEIQVYSEGQEIFTDKYAVLCDYSYGGCGAEGMHSKHKEEAIEAWNQRHEQWVSVDKLFLSSWPYGKLRPVKILGEHPSIEDGIYIEYLDGKGGTDTTTNEFLFDLPNPPKGDKDEL